MATAIGDILRRYWRHHLPRRVAELEQKLLPVDPEEIDLLHADRVAAIVRQRTGLTPSEYSGLDAGAKVVWLEKALAGGDTKTGGRGRAKGSGPRKVVVAITEVVRHPELPDAEIARRAGCDRSYLSRSTEYQKNADMARRALARQQRHAEYDRRSGELHPVDETLPEDLLDC